MKWKTYQLVTFTNLTYTVLSICTFIFLRILHILKKVKIVLVNVIVRK